MHEGEFMNSVLDVPKLKSFVPGDTRRYEQAHIIWIILTGIVLSGRKSITYGELAELMGYGKQAGRTLAGALGLVSIYCLYNGLPPLSVIVVRKNTDEPGWLDMIRHGRTLQDEQKEVHQTYWHHFRVPSVGTFRKANESLNWQQVLKMNEG